MYEKIVTEGCHKRIKKLHLLKKRETLVIHCDSSVCENSDNKMYACV